MCDVTIVENYLTWRAITRIINYREKGKSFRIILTEYK